MHLRPLYLSILALYLSFHPHLYGQKKQVQDSEQSKTIFKLLYEEKFATALSLLKPLAQDSQYYQDLLAGVRIQTLVYEEKWDDIIAFALPSDLGTLGKSLTYIGKGMAFAHKRKMQEAINHIKLLNQLKSGDDYQRLQKQIDFSSLFLSGYLRLRQRKFNNTLRLFKRAAKIEEGLGVKNAYSWVYNALFYLGFTYEVTSRKHEAVATYKKVLKKWPGMQKAVTKVKQIPI